MRPEEEGAVVFPVGGDGGVPVADPVHLLKVSLQQVAPQTVALKVLCRPEPGDEEPLLRRRRSRELSARYRLADADLFSAAEGADA